MALWFGVDDLDGTVQEETIYHMAGSRTPEALTTARDRAAHPRRGPRAGRARHALQRRPRPPPASWPTRIVKVSPSVASSDHRRRRSALGAVRARRLRGISQSRMPHAEARRDDDALSAGPHRVEKAPASASGSRSRTQYLGLSDEEMDARIAAARADARRPPRHPRSPLPARRGDQVRRLHRRLVQARAARSRSTRTPSSSSSAACTSWPRAPTSWRCRTSR